MSGRTGNAKDVIAHASGEFRRRSEIKKSADLAVACSIFIAGNLRVAHSAQCGDLAVGDFETLHQKLAGIDCGIGIRVDEAFEEHGFSVRQAGDLQADGSGVGVADG